MTGEQARIGSDGDGLLSRRAELASNLERLRTRVERACDGADRPLDSVRLIVVTKYFPASDVQLLADLGVTDIGENRDQEAEAKIEQLRRHAQERADERGELGGIDTVHFIGRLQTNKAAHVARYADVVHSVDRPKLVAALARGAQQAGRDVRVLLQVSLDGDTARGGARIADLAGLAQAVQDARGLELGGVMAVAPLGVDPDEAFARLADVAGELRGEHPLATWVSAGMSGDLEAAIRHGATHLRVGTAILGSRQSLL